MNEEALMRAQKALALHDIYLAGADFWMAEDFFPSLSEETLTVQTRQKTYEHAQIIQLSEPAASDEDLDTQTLVRFKIELGLRLVRKKSDDAPDQTDADNSKKNNTNVRAEIISVFAVEYRAKAKEILDDTDALDEFGSKNSLFHVWPYWREYIQSTLARARIPQVVLPMFRLPSHAAKREEPSK